MLRILSDLTVVNRRDYSPDADTTAYEQGKWILSDGTMAMDGTSVPAGIIFNMTEVTTDGSEELSRDTNSIAYQSATASTYGAAGKITAITGPLHGVTDQFSTDNGTPSVGDPLCVSGGQLAAMAIGTHHPVAVLEAIRSNFDHRGTTYTTAWEFKTV